MSTIQTETAKRILVSKLLTTAFMFSLLENRVELIASQLKGTYVATKIEGTMTNEAKKRIEKRFRVLRASLFFDKTERMSKIDEDSRLNDLLLRERRKLKVEMFPTALVEGFRKGKNIIVMVYYMI